MEIFKMYEVVKSKHMRGWYDEDYYEDSCGIYKTKEEAESFVNDKIKGLVESIIADLNECKELNTFALDNFDKLKENGFSELLDYFCNGGRENIAEKVKEISEKTNIDIEFVPEIKKPHGELMYGYINEDQIIVEFRDDFIRFRYISKNDIDDDICKVKNRLKEIEEKLSMIKKDPLMYLEKYLDYDSDYYDDDDYGKYEIEEIEVLERDGKLYKLNEIK